MTESTTPAAEDTYRTTLTPEQYAVLRQGATERPFSGRYVHSKEAGVYRCAACANDLFRSDVKFDSGTGWPSFWEPVAPGSVELRPDSSHGMERIEARCGRCHSHLGHVFDDGPRPTGQRYCINSLALDLQSGEASPG